MTFHRLTVVLLGLAGALLGNDRFFQSADQLFQTAIYQEEVEGSLKGAIETYQTILNRFPGDRPMGAKALLRIGLCREKLGLREAREAYQRIIDQYPEQRQEVALAQERIAKLSKALASESGKPKLTKIRMPVKLDLSTLPQLSPDGQKIAYSLRGEIWIVPISGNVSPDLAGVPVKLPGVAEAQGPPAWSGDGRWIAYDFAQNLDAGVRDISLLSADGSRTIPLVQHPADDRLLGWAPGGDQILFSSDRLESGSLDIWIVTVEDGKARGAPALVRRNVGRVDIGPMGFTQDGSFYYAVRSGKSDVYLAVLDPEKAKVSTPAKNVAQGFEGANRCPAWSPDGKYLAYISDRGSGGPRSIALCILSLDTGEYRVLFPELKSMARMTWFADGESVLAMGGESGGLRLAADRMGGVRIINWGSISLINVKTAAVRTLVADDGTGSHSPRCTSDGKKILYGNDSWQEKVHRIISYDVESGQKKHIYHNSQPIARMDIAPDGKLLAFLDVADASLKVMPTEGGSPRVLYELEGMISGPAWSPDGKYIYFARYIKGTQRQELWRIPSAGGEPIRFDLTADGVMENLDIHPDGRRIVFDSHRSGREVWVMENFLPKKSSRQ